MKNVLKWIAALSPLAIMLAFAQTPSPPVSAPAPAPVETCGTLVAKKDAELRAMECPEGFVGQWFQERAANSCDWTPSEPQWFACSKEIEPQGKDDLPTEPVE